MPPQKKKNTKVQTKNQQKVTKAQSQIDATIYQSQNDDIESDNTNQEEYDNPIDDDIQVNIAPKSSPQIFTDGQTNDQKCRKRQSQNQKQTAQVILPDDAPLRQQPQRTRRQLANQNNDQIAPKQGSKSDSHTEVIKSCIPSNTHTMTRNAKKKENQDSNTLSNQQKEKGTNCSKTDDVENLDKQSQLKPEDMPLRLQRNNQHQLDMKNEMNKPQNSHINNSSFTKQQQPPNYQQNFNQSKQSQSQQQQVNKPASNIGNLQTSGNSMKILGIQSDSQKENSIENKILTNKEIEGLSKLLSIQVDGLKMKEQQMKNLLSHQINNNYTKFNNLKHINNNNFRAQNVQNSIHLQKNDNYPTSKYSINNLPQGQNPRKILKKTNDDQSNQQNLLQQNINNKKTQLNEQKNHIVIDDEFEDDIENQHFDVEDNILEEIHEVPQHCAQGPTKLYVDSNIPQRSITPQNKIFSSQNNLVRQQQNIQQNINGQYKQQDYYHDYNSNRAKNITPVRNNNGVGKFTPINNHNYQQAGKITPLNQKIGNQMLNGNPHTMNNIGKYSPINQNGKYSPMNGNGKYTPMNGKGKFTPITGSNPMNSNGKTTPMNNINGVSLQNVKINSLNNGSGGGKKTPIIYGNQQEQEKQQKNCSEIDIEIQQRIETIKNNIGPLLACLNSDYIGADKQNNQKQQQIHEPENNLDHNLKNRIYQDMRERRLNTFDNVSPNMQIQQQGVRGRSITPTVQGRRQFDSRTPTQSQNIGSKIEVERKVTPIRGFQQQQPINQMKEFRSYTPTRNYESRNKDWVCGFCKNFNYVSQTFCNRCGKIQDLNTQQEQSHTPNKNMNQINQNLYQELKKTPIRTVNDVKRTFQDIFQNKENLKNIQNVNNYQNNHQYSIQTQQRQITQKTYQRDIQADEPIIKTPQEKDKQTYNNRRQRITYKDFQNYENSLANKSNNETQSYSGNKVTQNTNKEPQVSSEIVGHKIVFIDNSSAEPNQNCNESINSRIDVSENTSHTESNDGINNNQKLKVNDPRIQIR